MNLYTGQVRGFVKQIGGDWIIVGEPEIGKIDSEHRFLEDVICTSNANHHRGMQAFHSTYLYQIDLHLNFDYELVLTNGGTLCITFGYINALVTAANAVFEKEITIHIKVKSMKQTDVYDQAKATDETILIMKEEHSKVQVEGIDLHFALLGKKFSGGRGNVAGIDFVEGSLCDLSRTFGLVSGLGSFDSLGGQFGFDLKRFVYILA